MWNPFFTGFLVPAPFAVLYCFDGLLSLLTGSVFKPESPSLPLLSPSRSLMMCLSDANEWFLRCSSASPFPFFFFFSPSACLICQRERFFFFGYETPSGRFYRKTLMTSLVFGGLAMWRLEGLSVSGGLCIRDSQLAIRRECLGRWCAYLHVLLKRAVCVCVYTCSFALACTKQKKNPVCCVAPPWLTALLCWDLEL